MNIENNFAEFEASAAKGEELPADPPASAETAAEAAEQPEPTNDAEKPLELAEGDEAVDAGEEGGEEHTDEEGRKRRSKPASQRIAELTAKLRAAERERDEARAAAKPVEQTEAPTEPDPADYEYGESDPGYMKALIKHEREMAKHEARAEAAEEAKANAATAERNAIVAKIDTGVALAEEAAKAKYDDFDEKISAAVEARGGASLPPMLTIGIGVSPVGGDLIYRLATDEAVSSKLEKLADNPHAMALALGELEGEYIEGNDDSDLDVTDQLDMARMLGRLRARVAGKATVQKPTIKPTEAPEPPAHRARGGTGRFEVGADTTDFAAFERKANGKR